MTPVGVGKTYTFTGETPGTLTFFIPVNSVRTIAWNLLVAPGASGARQADAECRPRRCPPTTAVQDREDPVVSPSQRFLSGRRLSLSLLLSVAAPAAMGGAVSTNLVRDFDFSGSLVSPIDAVLALGSADDAFRLSNDRLGEWLGTTATINYTHRYGISLLDPGVSTLPDEVRMLFRAQSDAVFAGGELLPSNHLSVLNQYWGCSTDILQCTTGMVYSQRAGTINANAFSDMTSVLQGFSLSTSAQTEVLFEGVQLLASEVRVRGALTVHTRYAGKTTNAYIADALQATVQDAGLSSPGRYASAAADLAALQGAAYTSVPVPANERVSADPELQKAVDTLVVAREAATLIDAATTGGTRFDSRSDLLRQIWDLGAAGMPGSGRSSAGFSTDPVLPSAELELATLRAVMTSGDDASFLAALSVQPAALLASADPLVIFSGEPFGLAGAELSIYYVGNDDGSGLAALNLRAAQRHVIYRDFSDRLTLLEGPGSGLHFIAPNGDEGLAPLNEETYFGEGMGGVLTVSGDGTAIRLSLNNLYSPRLLAVASFGVTPVPEPAPVLLMLAGLACVARAAARRRRIAPS